MQSSQQSAATIERRQAHMLPATSRADARSKQERRTDAASVSERGRKAEGRVEGTRRLHFLPVFGCCDPSSQSREREARNTERKEMHEHISSPRFFSSHFHHRALFPFIHLTTPLSPHHNYSQSPQTSKHTPLSPCLHITLSITSHPHHPPAVAWPPLPRGRACASGRSRWSSR